jgi:hypothetical protein
VKDQRRNVSDVGALGELVAQSDSEDRQKGKGRGSKKEIHGENSCFYVSPHRFATQMPNLAQKCALVISVVLAAACKISIAV